MGLITDPEARKGSGYSNQSGIHWMDERVEKRPNIASYGH
jgi:hypothetical protein